ncbi:hypothetical protein BPAE_0288g00010 [Botrytis paeoniae]|uniref:ribonuclease H n=1 Tax=Botrytis paeoniae TaxID=278948 RepID=A0A4Z1FB30_9HELO|nr:hypothetical protein BPAE_0288g00010 [Botrytis paeoniae]
MLEKYLLREARRDKERSLEDQQIFSRKFDLHQYFSPASRNTKRFIYYDTSTGISHVHDANEMAGDKKSLVVAVDGACPHNGSELAKTSSVGVFFGPHSPFNMYEKITRNDGIKHTNNYAELVAASFALHLIKNSSLFKQWRANHETRLTAIIMTDSTYVHSIFTTWIWNWRKNGFKGSNGPVANRQSIEKIDKMIQSLKNCNIEVRFWKVPREDNKEADKLANAVFANTLLNVCGDSISRPCALSRLYAPNSIQADNPLLEQFGLHHLKGKSFVPLIELILPLVLSGRDTQQNFLSLIGPNCDGGSFWLAWCFIRLALYLVLESKLHATGEIISGSWQPIRTNRFECTAYNNSFPRDFSADIVPTLRRMKEEWLYLNEETVNSLSIIMERMKDTIHRIPMRPMGPFVVGATMLALSMDTEH